MSYGLEGYNSSGIPYIHDKSPFQAILRLEVRDLAIVSNYNIPISNVESGSSLHVVTGLFGASSPDLVVSLGGSLNLSMKTAVFSGNNLMITTEDTFGEDAPRYFFTIFTRRT